MTRYCEMAELLRFLRTKAVDIYAPVSDGTRLAFRKLAEGDTPDFTRLADNSVKDILLPQVETLMRFEMKDGLIDVVEESGCKRDFAVLGVRACDMSAVDVLDKVLLSGFADRWYEKRRDAMTVFSLACEEYGENCFCDAFSVNAAAPDGDVRMRKRGDGYLLTALTEKGEKLLFESPFEEAEEVPQAQPDESRRRVRVAPVSDVGTTKELFDLKLWKTLSRACLSCGSCTFACPTCTCYDISERDGGKRRVRTWDSCMYSDFTLMAGGTPRPNKDQRFRQRFLHKLIYSRENIGRFACVGCGRCVSACPSALHMPRVLSALARERGKKE